MTSLPLLACLLSLVTGRKFSPRRLLNHASVAQITLINAEPSYYQAEWKELNQMGMNQAWWRPGDQACMR